MSSFGEKLPGSIKEKLPRFSKLGDPANFDETGYLMRYPDVAAAVVAGDFASGQQHYKLHGYREGRLARGMNRPEPLTLPFAEGANPSRRDKILANLRIGDIEGLEIGALASPTVTPGEGRIFYVDHVDTETLLKKYANDPSVDKASIVNVDAVWGAQSLQDCVGINNKVDYVVASHVIEHVPDLITWLGEIHSILRDNGSLRLAIPDRRYTFDFLKNETRVHDVLDAFMRRARAPMARQILEHFGWAVTVNCEAAWNGTLALSELKPIHSWKDAIGLAQDALANQKYHDAHCWIFTPLSFAKLGIQLVELGLLPFSCDYCIETARNQLEFYVALTPCANQTRALDSWTRIVDQLNNSKTYQHTDRAVPRGDS